MSPQSTKSQVTAMLHKTCVTPMAMIWNEFSPLSHIEAVMSRLHIDEIGKYSLLPVLASLGVIRCSAISPGVDLILEDSIWVCRWLECQCWRWPSHEKVCNEPAATSGRPGAASGSFSGTAVGGKISMAAIVRGFVKCSHCLTSGKRNS